MKVIKFKIDFEGVYTRRVRRPKDADLLLAHYVHSFLTQPAPKVKVIDSIRRPA